MQVLVSRHLSIVCLFYKKICYYLYYILLETLFLGNFLTKEIGKNYIFFDVFWLKINRGDPYEFFPPAVSYVIYFTITSNIHNSGNFYQKMLPGWQMKDFEIYFYFLGLFRGIGLKG